MKSKRLAHIDVLELIAMYFVILHHSTSHPNTLPAEFNSPSTLMYYFSTLLSTSVPLFFFTNGYLLFRKAFDLRKHILKSCKLFILTIIWAIITLLLLQPANHETLSLTELVKAVWEWKQGWINHLWYMGALICIYILFPILKNTYDSNYRLFLYFTVICAVLTVGNTFLNHFGTVFANLFLGKSLVLNSFNFFNIFNPFRGIRGYSFVYFCLGGIAYRSEHIIKNFDNKIRNTVSVVGILASCFSLFFIGCTYSKLTNSLWNVVWYGLDSIFTLINVVCIYILSLNWRRDLTIVRLISSNTLGIYFIHNILIAYFKYQIVNFSCAASLLFILIYAMCILLLSLSISIIFKKLPVVSRLVT